MKPTHDNRARRPTLYSPSRHALFLIALVPLLASCAGVPPDSPPPPFGATPRPAQPDPNVRPAAIVNDQPIAWDDLRPALAEAAGGVVLEELALDRLVAAEYRARLNKGAADITNDQIAAERQYLTDSIRRSSAASPDEAATLAANLRKTRGLGNARFTALLRRNAIMRELVAPDVSITPDMLQQRFDVRFGPRYRVRILTTATEAQAADALRELQDGADSLSPRFAALAARTSTDESRTRGGEIEPISPADPAYSPALRAALAALQPGQLSGVLALDPGFGIALLEEVIPAADTTPDDRRAELQEELRRRQERLLMDTLARRLLQSAHIVVLDPSLAWSWQNRQTERQP